MTLSFLNELVQTTEVFDYQPVHVLHLSDLNLLTLEQAVIENWHQDPPSCTEEINRRSYTMLEAQTWTEINKKNSLGIAGQFIMNLTNSLRAETEPISLFETSNLGSNTLDGSDVAENETDSSLGIGWLPRELALPP